MGKRIERIKRMAGKPVSLLSTLTEGLRAFVTLEPGYRALEVNAEGVVTKMELLELSIVSDADKYAATLSPKDRKYRAGYMALWKGCKGYCVASTGGREPRSGQCPFCGAT